MNTRLHSLKVIMPLALVVMTCAGLASCGGGGGGGSRPASGGGGDQMMILPPTGNRTPDHSDTPAAATTIALRQSIPGRIDSPNDVDYFRLRVNAPGTLTIRTTGTADPDIAVFDAERIEVPGVTGSWIGTITQAILDKGDLLVKFSGGNEGEEYTARATLDQPSQISPDLTVGSPTVSDSNPAAGASFTLSATVSNAGDGESAATTLRYYRSTDATITTSDTEVGTDAVAGLAASGSDSQSVELVAPSAPGTYHYGACVDAVAGESDTTNNCSTAVQVTVPAPERPDLMVVSSSVSNNSPTVGSQFTLSATVRNAGGGESAATTLRYYRSTDGTITTSDTDVGTDAVAGLAASGSDSQSVELVAPSAPGTYHYGACVETVAGEFDTTNNCSTAVQVTVPAPERPDLTIVSSSVSNNSPTVGSQFTLSATVQNDGNGESAATTLRYYRSTDGTITTSDTEVGTDAVAGLAASGSNSQSVELVAPSAPAGAYYYGACVDTVTDESDTADNCSGSVKVDVEAPKHPDLEVGTPTVSDTSPETGVSFTLSATVSNAGDGGSVATTLRYYRSTDGTITTSDMEVGTDAVAGLAASGSDSQSVELVAPSAPGPYYYGACVDTVAGESDTANNCSTAVDVTVLVTQVQIQGSPDLEVGTPTVSDTSPETGASFTLSATVSNAGDGGSVATTLRYYRSTDGTITRSDTAVGTDAVGALAASGTSAQSISLTAPTTAGAYYYGACVDTVTDESDTADNCSGSVKVDVEAPKHPDLEVGTPLVDDAGPETGATFTMSATVSNTGNGESAATTLRYYRSTDATITRSDTAVGTDAVGALAASGTSAQSISLTATAGAYYYGACVDTVTDESDTTDNCSGSVKVDVEAPKYPDLKVGTPTVSDTSPETGASFTLSATVSNAGMTGIGSDDTAVLPVDGRDDHEIGHGGGDGRGGCACGIGDQCGVDFVDGAGDGGSVLLRGVRGHGDGRIRHGRQLLGVGEGGRGGAEVSGPQGRDADGERHESRDGGEFHDVGDGEQHGRRGIGSDDTAVLPVDGRDDHEIGHGGGDGRGGCACGIGDQCAVDITDGDGGSVLLRGVCGHGDGRIRHDRQLLGVGEGGRGGTARVQD